MYPTATPVPVLTPIPGQNPYDFGYLLLRTEPVQLMLFIGVLLMLAFLAIALSFLIRQWKTPKDKSSINNLLSDLVDLTKKTLDQGVENLNIQQQTLKNYAALQTIDSKMNVVVNAIPQLVTRFEGIERDFADNLKVLNNTFEAGMIRLTNSITGMQTELVSKIQAVVSAGDTNAKNVIKEILRVLEDNKLHQDEKIDTNGTKTRDQLEALAKELRPLLATLSTVQSSIAGLSERINRLANNTEESTVRRDAKQDELVKIVQSVVEQQKKIEGVVEQIKTALDEHLIKPPQPPAA